MDGLVHDLRFCARCLKRHPGINALALFTLALGIGAAVGIFSVFHAVLLRPLPFEDPGQLVNIWNSRPELAKGPVSPPDFADMTAELTLFEGLAGRFVPFDLTLTGGDEPAHMMGQWVTHDLFQLLGVRPFLGRGFSAEDAVPPAEREDTTEAYVPVVILSHGLWQRNFGADPQVLGSTVQINGWPVEVVGIMPEGFQIPQESEWGRPEDVDLWSPIAWNMADGDRFFRNVRVLGRLKPGATVEQAQAELDAFYARMRERFARHEELQNRAYVVGMHEDVVAHVRPSLVMVAGGVTFLLLLACANVASLLMIRAQGLAQEMAVRAALGCGRTRLVRQTLIESLLLSFSGGIIGLALGYLGIRFFLAYQPLSALRLEAVTLNSSVVFFSMALCTLVGVSFGIFPALKAWRLDLVTALKNQAPGSGRGRRGRTLRALVIGEVALSMALLLGASLMIRSVVALQRSDPGFDPDGVLTVAINLYGERYWGEGASIAFFQELEREVRALPGVRSVGTISLLPLTGQRFRTRWGVGTEDDPRWMGLAAHRRFVSGELFQALGTRLRIGRTFADAELSEESSVVVVGESLARMGWPGENPIGKKLISSAGGEPGSFEIIGVVEDVRFEDPSRVVAPAIYWPMGTMPSWAQKVVVRSTSPPGGLATPIREIVRGLDPALAPHSVHEMNDLVRRALAPSRFVMALMALFAILAAVLAVGGLYGVVAHAVRQRVPEIGIRMAFGAETSSILRMILGEGGILVAGGVAVGLLGSLAVSRFIQGFLFGVVPTDLDTLLATAVGLSLVALLACWVAARQATHVDPVSALRAE